ncbi:unnamed protein product, partial [Vitis vinifera]|uniref:Uncharacterized protein n=1 Tax=Vitis vinifera TaxID=29760 RepID=D7UAM3_VITVI
MTTSKINRKIGKTSGGKLRPSEDLWVELPCNFFQGETRHRSMEEKPSRRKLSIPKINIAEIKKQSPSPLSPTAQSCTAKPSSARANCLCSPTTHVGSFRCRHHRSRSHSRSDSSSSLSSLSELGSKPDTITDTIEAQ